MKILSKKSAALCGVGTIIGILMLNHPEIQTSEKGLALIGNKEGCMRDPYHCPADVLTVGIGSTEASGEKIDPQKRYTDREIAARWAKDLTIAENCVRNYGNGNAMPQGAFDAMTSITFNVGCGAMKKSTLFKLAKQGYSPAICEEFSKWVYAGGKVMKGLVTRRQQERALCLQAVAKSSNSVK